MVPTICPVVRTWASAAMATSANRTVMTVTMRTLLSGI